MHGAVACSALAHRESDPSRLPPHRGIPLMPTQSAVRRRPLILCDRPTVGKSGGAASSIHRRKTQVLDRYRRDCQVGLANFSSLWRIRHIRPVTRPHPAARPSASLRQEFSTERAALRPVDDSRRDPEESYAESLFTVSLRGARSLRLCRCRPLRGPPMDLSERAQYRHDARSNLPLHNRFRAASHR
ncbi:MAG: hypothetical protein QOF66_1779 [Mycobacterium sp.]|jgi:hypothetical protein|nr:hypothetical protein [Mycobacterium sp.]MDT5053413.1 hypothetical protein [Mycobacterium sp.]